MRYVSRGFTLIELLVVIAIIAILAAILFPVFARAREKARQSTCSSNQRQIAAAVQMYVQDHDETLPASSAIWQAINVDAGVLICPTKGKTTPNGYMYNSYISGKALGTIRDPVAMFLTADTNTAGNYFSFPEDFDWRHSGKAIVSCVDGHVEARSSDSLNTLSESVGIGFWNYAYSNTAFTGTPIVRQLNAYDISNFNWGSGGPISTVVDNFGVMWRDCKLVVPVSGNYTFSGYTDDTNWCSVTYPSNPPVSYTFSGGHGVGDTVSTGLTMSLQAGTEYNFTFKYTENGGVAFGNLYWTLPGASSPSLIPYTDFRYCLPRP